MYYPSRSGKPGQKREKIGWTLLRFDPLNHTSAMVALKNERNRLNIEYKRSVDMEMKLTTEIDHYSMSRFWQFLKGCDLQKYW